MLTDILDEPETEEIIHNTEPFEYSYFVKSDVISLDLTPARIIFEAKKVEERIQDLILTGKYPLIPNSPFDLQKEETQLSLEEILDQSYLETKKVKKHLEQIIREANNNPVIVASESALLRKNNLLLIHHGHSQGELTPEIVAVADTLALCGLKVGMNGQGNNNSKSILHIQLYDTRKVPNHKYETDRMSIVTIEDTPKIYRQFLHEGRFVSLAFLGNGTVGFVEQKLPTSLPINRENFPYSIDPNRLTEDQWRYLYIRMWLGLGCLESTTNTVVNKIPNLSTIDHKNLYELFFSKPEDNSEFDFDEFNRITKHVDLTILNKGLQNHKLS